MISFVKYCFMLIAILPLLSMPVYSEVAGMGFKATLRNFNIESYNLHLDSNASCFMHFSSDYGKFAIDMREFIKRTGLGVEAGKGEL